MMNILKRFELDNWTYGLLIVALLCGFFKQILFILLIIIIHELGHILMLIHYEVFIISIKLYPFGGITKVEKDINTPIKQELIIAISGIVAQGFLWLFFLLLQKYGFIYEYTYRLFVQYNLAIILFNLLPIIPLDGSIILRGFFEYFFPYEKAYKYYFFLSAIGLFFFFAFNIAWNLNNYVMIFFLIFQLFIGLKHYRYYVQKFYLERYLYEYSFRQIKSHDIDDIKLLKKDTLHFFKRNNKYLHERELLKEKFDNSPNI